MTVKTILTPVSSAEASRAALESAIAIARRFRALIEALHIRTDPKGLVPYTGEGMNGSMIEDIMEATEREAGARAVEAKKMFDEICAANNVTVGGGVGSGAAAVWHEETGREDEIVALRGRLADVIIVGRPVKDSVMPSTVTLESALLDTGRPILIVPPDGGGEIGLNIAVAWEGSPEAARAVNESLPFLERAESVTILTALDTDVALDPEELSQRLAWHDIKSTVHKFETAGVEIGAALLAEAKNLGADLMVKGAYSHSRLRQMILGTRTRHIITHTEMPVLLSH